MRQAAFLLMITGVFLATDGPCRGAEVYYVNQPELQPGRINVVKPDGTGHANVWTASQVTDVRGIAVDGATGTLFFHYSNQNPGTLATTQVSLQKMATTGGAQTTIATIADNTFVGDVEFDAEGGWVYSAVSGALQLRRCRPDGSSQQTVLTHTAAGQGPYFFCIDTVAQVAFWGIATVANQTNTGYSRGTLVGAIDASFSLVTPSRTRDIEIDNTIPGGRLYWNDRQNGATYFRAVAGGTAGTARSGMNAPHGLVIDVEAGKGYVADTGKRGSASQPAAHRVVRFNLDGTGGLELLSPLDTGAEPWDLALDFTTRSYADWRTRYFASTAPNAGPGADPDGDGVVNAAEYAFFSHPERSQSVPPAVTALGAGMRYLRRTTTDLTYRVEVSTDLFVWHWNEDSPGAVWTTETATETRDYDAQWVTVAPTPAIAGQTKLYFRLRATLP